MQGAALRSRAKRKPAQNRNFLCGLLIKAQRPSSHKKSPGFAATPGQRAVALGEASVRFGFLFMRWLRVSKPPATDVCRATIPARLGELRGL